MPLLNRAEENSRNTEEITSGFAECEKTLHKTHWFITKSQQNLLIDLKIVKEWELNFLSPALFNSISH